MGKDKKVNYPLEIYHPGISAGDAAVIVTRNSEGKISKTVLIDLGCNAEEIYTWSVNHIKNFNTTSKFTFIILSHYHTDHYGGLKHNSIKADNFISSYRNSDTKKHQLIKTLKDNKATSNETLANAVSSYNILDGIYDELKKQHDDEKMEEEEENEIIESEEVESKGNNEKVKPPWLTVDLTPPWKDKKYKVELKCICANGVYLNEQEKWEVADGKFTDRNDHSIAWLLEFFVDGKVTFRYFTAGDLSGNDTGGYTDIEKNLINYLNGKTINLLKATHHGSMHSLSEDFLKCVKPEEIVVPSNYSHKLPFPHFFERINDIADYNPKIYLTNYFQVEQNEYWNAGSFKGDEESVTKMFNTVVPKVETVEIGKTDYYQIIVDEKKANHIFYEKEKFENTKEKVKEAVKVPVFKTSIGEDGKVEKTDLLYYIQIPLEGPSPGKRDLPHLWAHEDDSYTEKFSKKCFELALKQAKQESKQLPKDFIEKLPKNQDETQEFVENYIKKAESEISKKKQALIQARKKGENDKIKKINKAINTIINTITAIRLHYTLDFYGAYEKEGNFYTSKSTIDAEVKSELKTAFSKVLKVSGINYERYLKDPFYNDNDKSPRNVHRSIIDAERIFGKQDPKPWLIEKNRQASIKRRKIQSIQKKKDEKERRKKRKEEKEIKQREQREKERKEREKLTSPKKVVKSHTMRKKLLKK